MSSLPNGDSIVYVAYVCAEIPVWAQKSVDDFYQNYCSSNLISSCISYLPAIIVFFASFMLFRRLDLFSGAITATNQKGLIRNSSIFWLILSLLALASFYLGALGSILLVQKFNGSSIGKFFGSATLLAQALSPLGSLVLLGIVSFGVGQEIRKEVFGTSNGWLSFCKGFALGFAVFPFITIIVNFSLAILSWATGLEPIDQSSFLFMKRLLDYPSLFIFAALSVSCIVPIAEEILFRGFFIPTLTRILQPKLVALISGMIFALFHITSEQGITNIALFIGLTLFGVLAANVKHTYKSLSATIGMHAAFNTLTLILLLIENF